MDDTRNERRMTWDELAKENLELKKRLQTQRAEVVEEIRNLVLDDVPHKYQKRLLEYLDEKAS